MSEQILSKEMPVLLTRGEVRKLLCVNEKTIDSWLRGGRLEQVPGSQVAGSDSEALIALQDSSLRERFEKSIQKRGSVELAFELLPAVARFQLLQMMLDRGASSTETGEARQGRIRPVRRRPRQKLVRRARGRQATAARWESSEVTVQRQRPGRTRKSASRPARRLRASHARRRTGTGKRQRSTSLGQSQHEELVDMLFPAEKQRESQRRRPSPSPAKESGKELSALQSIADLSDQPNVAEEMWGDELLSLVRDVAESVADEIGDRIQVEQSVQPEAVVDTEVAGIDPKTMPGGEDEIWLALEGVEDTAILKGTEDVLFASTGEELDDQLAQPLAEPEIFEVELIGDQGGELVAFLVGEEVADEKVEEPSSDTREEPPRVNLPVEEPPEVDRHEDLKAEADSAVEEELAPSEDDGFLELELDHDEWMPAEEMVEALSHSPVFAAVEPVEPGAEVPEPSRSSARQYAPTELEIDELLTPLTEEEASEVASEFVSEEAAALYRVEDELARLGEVLEHHQEEEFAEFSEIRADIAATWEQQELVSASLTTIGKDLKAVKKEARSSGRTARSSLAVSRRTQSQIRRKLASLKLGGAELGFGSVLPIAAGLMIVSWAMTIYFKTGDLRSALGGLVLVNLLACVSMLHSKTGRFF